jgi:hypothetical protein
MRSPSSVRQERSRPLIVKLDVWLREQRAKLSGNGDTTKVINYCLSRWGAFTRFLDDGRLCMSNNAAERELRAVATTCSLYPLNPRLRTRQGWIGCPSFVVGNRIQQLASPFLYIIISYISGILPRGMLK